ncbi:MurR/RpiR family transcriptional regulator [Bifidobacterium eulemuris]|uniref:Fe-S cluster assembly protein HesB n=1 Tax=Bifidobacterium eulemuris TaxID=1765219 RepID=A0A261GAE6_9BIFI|nr:MurR/RpiR family transcriptional regulator [Bifidobacterium eulemuris]OZG68155.1 Fe-S cluster assembly protein HesB [Bifidobacterium eulemuris]QOL31783.1 MurR/RpiR family transcriptional regulator [Bifidobacterium eulemuris]
MHTLTGIRERIDHVYPNLRPAERAAASYVRNHIAQAAELTVGQLADAAHVSQPTVIRFARKLGFGGYRELRYALRHPEAEHRVTFDPLSGFDINPWDSPDEVPAKAMVGISAVIDELRRALDITAFRKTCAALRTTSLIDVYAVENSLVPATDLFTKLSYLGLPCRLNTDAYLQHIGAGHLPQDAVAVAISHSGTSADTVAALRLAKSAGAKTIAVTNTPSSPLAATADITLLTGTNEHTIHGNAIFSRVADVALVDMLYMGVLLSDYGRFSTALDESGRMIRDRAVSL